MSNQEQFQRSIEKIKFKFLATLNSKADEFDGLLDRISKQDNAEEALQDIRINAHKIRGTAPTFGLRQIGDLAATVEDSIVDLSNPACDQQATVETLMAAFRGLVSELRLTAASEHPPNEARA